MSWHRVHPMEIKYCIVGQRFRGAEVIAIDLDGMRVDLENRPLTLSIEDENVDEFVDEFVRDELARTDKTRWA